MTPYPIKDFRDPANYPDWEGVDIWRWEFLRRSPAYQAFHDHHKNDQRPPPGCHDFGIHSLYDPRHDDAYMGFSPTGTIINLPTFEWIERWQKVPGYTSERALFSILGTLTELQARGDALVVINRALPIEPQLETIRRAIDDRNELEDQTPPLRNARRQEWPSYLRILDATAEGVSADQIATVLYPQTDNTYPDFAARKRVEKAAIRAAYLMQTFAVKGFSEK